jgi:hypothetical protein
MLDVTYEAVDDLAPGKLAKINENKGTIRVRLSRTGPLPDVVDQLNGEISRLMRSARWFQLWREEIVSSRTPGRPLHIEYVLERKEDHGTYVEERRGILVVFIDPALSVEEFVASMNPVTQAHLDGGHWFQLYDGEIIDN